MDREEKEARLQLYTGVRDLKKNWGWFFALGLILIALGIVAMGSTVSVTLASMFFFGILLVIGGIVQAVNAFKGIKGSGFLVNILISILYIVSGAILIMHPAEGAITLTLLLAAFYVVSGMFKIVAALANRYAHWGWLLFSGIVSLILGLLIWSQWPAAGLWVIGLFIGIDLIILGWIWVALSLSAKDADVKRL